MKTIYFVGIKGVAMSALAVYWRQEGVRVLGSDVAEEFPTDEELKRAKITVLEGFDPAHLTENPRPDLVIYTGAHGGRENPEVQKALSLDIPILSQAQALGEAMKNHTQISVAGSHGKTTTSAMIATILTVCGKDPSYAIGCGGITGLGFAGHKGESGYFVAEADEYVNDPEHDMTPRFLWQHPNVLVVTNIDYDHPDVYGSVEEVLAAFQRLVAQQKGKRVLILNEDDPASRPLRKASGQAVMTFGFSPNAMVRVDRVASGSERTFFSLSLNGVAVGEFTLKVPGRHNVANAAAAAAACIALGLTWDEIRKGLLAFNGTKRRFEKIAETKDIVLYDDYAHHPKEIEATIAAARLWYPKRRVVTIFQPHTYSRTKALLSSFGTAFAKSDVAVITDIYASAREEDTKEISGTILASEIAKHHANVLFAGTYEKLEAEILSRVHPGDVVIGMGAGSIYTWIRRIAQRLKDSE